MLPSSSLLSLTICHAYQVRLPNNLSDVILFVHLEGQVQATKHIADSDKPGSLTTQGVVPRMTTTGPLFRCGPIENFHELLTLAKLLCSRHYKIILVPASPLRCAVTKTLPMFLLLSEPRKSTLMTAMLDLLLNGAPLKAHHLFGLAIAEVLLCFMSAHQFSSSCLTRLAWSSHRLVRGVRPHWHCLHRRACDGANWCWI
mmetsp:Transcript_69468/g.120332  ORF Transcript_69468/g.120332 Transcript_69468/m.120332 type:complete len:200 (+) Transcript_69468:3764-4363(+)